MMDNLPTGWTSVPLKDIATVFLGKTPARSEYCSKGKYKVIKFRDLKSGHVDFSNAKDGYVMDKTGIVSSLRPLQEKDVLITSAAHSGENIGKKCAYIKRIPNQFEGVFFTGELLNIRAEYDETLARWSYLYFLSAKGFKEIQSAVKGVHLTSGRANMMQIDIAPLNEQRRIVAKLEKLLQKVDACKDRLDKIPAILKRFRQSVLAAACSGRLTADWREKCPNIESSIDHLKSFMKTRKREVNFDSHEIHNWTLTQVKSLYDSFGGGTPSKNRTEFWNGAIPWVSSGDVKTDKIEQGTYFITQEGLENSSASMCPEHSIIVVVRSGVLKHVLPVSVVQKPLAINQDIKCFDSTDKHLNYWLLLNLKAYQNEILKLNREGTTVQSVKYDTLKNFRINIPPTAEQQEIVRCVEALFKIADQIEERYHKARAYVDKLTQSILAKVFRGELVPQDPNDEPASELLKKIKDESNYDEEKSKKIDSAKKNFRKRDKLHVSDK